MLQQELDKICAWVIQYNTYFERYYNNVQLNETTGIINNGTEYVFPNDTLGNYFYLRIPSRLSPIYDNNNDNANRSMGVSVPLTLVASVQDADPYKLAVNLISTIGRICDAGKRMSAILIHNEDVISQELAKCDENIVLKALQNGADGQTLVAINFTYTYNQPYLQLNCIENPCKSCS